MKGYCGTFGYDLATDIANSLCVLLKRMSSAGAEILHVAEAHIKCLAIVVEHDITGSGGSRGEALLAKLEGARTRALGDV